MNTTTDTGRRMASREELEELHRLLVTDLRRCLSTKDQKKLPCAELLAVTRKTLKDNGIGAPDEAAQKALQALYRLYLRRLADALGPLAEGAPVPAALLAEARALLSWHGVGDIPAASASKVAQHLLQANVPFKTHH